MAKSSPSDYARLQAAKRVFNAKSAKKGYGILYRHVEEIKDKSSLQHLKNEAAERGFHIVRIDDIYVILCGKPEIEIIC